MLSKKFRLTKKDHIKYILDQGGSLANDFFIFKIIKNPPAPLGEKNQEKPNSAFCLIISSKFKLGGVKRNLLRRRLYEALRLNYSLLNNKEPHHIAIIVRNPALKANYKMIEKKITHLLKII